MLSIRNFQVGRAGQPVAVLADAEVASILTGTFQLANDGEKGLFFVIDDGSARIIERVDG